jgi:peptide/nickel transport system ATP-binding protein
MICSRVAVFRDGHLIEFGDVGDVLNNPEEDYTRTLIASAPRFSTEQAL